MTTFGIILIFCILPLIFGYIFLKFIVGERECIMLNWRFHLTMTPLYFLEGLCFSLLSLILFFSISFWGVNPELIASSCKEVPIYSLTKCMTTNVDINKNSPFQLGRGNDNSTYSFLTYNNNHYAFEEVTSKNFKIIYTDSINPKVVINATKSVAKPRTCKWLFKDEYCTLEKEQWSGTIYIPKGSIIRPYKCIEKK